MARKSVRNSPANAGGTTTVSNAVLQRAENQIEGCAGCDTASDVPFGAMLRCFVTDRSAETYVFERSAKCPNCGSTLTVSTLVSWD